MAPGAERIDRSGSRAVLIGVSDYEDPAFPSVPAAANSLSGMRRMLLDEELGGWSDRQVHDLDTVDCRHVMRELRRHAQETSGVLLLYFVGHGTLTMDGQLVLAVSDTVADEPEYTGLEYSKIRTILLRSPARTKVVVLDCCYSGRAVDVLASDRQDLADITDVRGAYVLTAADRVAHAGRSGTCTAFTGELLNLIDEGIVGGPPVLTFAELYPHLRRRLTSRGLPQPNQRGTDTADRWPVVRNASDEIAEAERINDRERRWARQLRAEREHRESLEKALAEALRSRTAPPDQPDQPTPAGTTAPPSGPWDRNDFTDEDEDPCDGRIDMGGLLVPEVEGMELRVEVAGGTIVAATVVLRDSAIQFQAFAAPRHEGIWDGIREEIAVGITGEGGSVEDVEGPLGRELRAVVPIQLPDGSQGHRTVRFVGADGPRWFLRGVISGRAAVEQEAARDVEQLFRDAVVVRGHGPLAPRDPIALRMPPNAETVAEGQAPQQRTS